MTSEERKNARRIRRQEAREKKRKAAIEQFDDFGLITDADNLCRSFHLCKRGVAWKESVQRFEASLFRNIAELRRKLISGESVQSGFVEFILRERGKIRHIKSIHISERIVQKSLCDNVLLPAIMPCLIHDNGASIKGKGVHFAIRRLICHLSRFYRRHKTNTGYALLIDFSKFFDSIDHTVLFKLIEERIHDPQIRHLFRCFVSVFGEGKSLGLGSQVSQVAAIYYPSELDHFIKERLRIKYYGRYMDDMYLIHSDKNYLWDCLKKIRAVCDSLKITMNEKKTRIVKLEDGVFFLKGKYVLLSSGKVLKLPDKSGALRMGRKLKKFKAMVDAGEMGYDDLRTAYQSWRGNFQNRFNAHYSISRLDSLYNDLFIKQSHDGGNYVSGGKKRKSVLPQNT